MKRKEVIKVMRVCSPLRQSCHFMARKKGQTSKVKSVERIERKELQGAEVIITLKREKAS